MSVGELEITRNTSEVAVCCSAGFPQLVEQPSVLDRNDRLVGEGGDQLYLLVGKGAHLVAGERKDANHRPVAQKRHAKDRPVSECLLMIGHMVFRIG